MEEIKSCLICRIVLHAVLSRTADATITVVSSVINDSAFFNCSTISDNVEWFFGSDPYDRSYIYSYETVTLQYRHRFRMENYTNGFVNQFNLILQPVTKDDAGSYTCSHNEAGSRAEKEVLLIVLETGPTCVEYWNAEGVIGPNSCGIEPETVQLSCSLRYIGRNAPTLTWVKVVEYIPIKPPSTECFDSGHTYTCNLTMKSNLLMDGFSYICQTTGPATKQYSCTSKAIKIIYATAVENLEINATVNDNVSCSVSSSQSCNYLWKSNISEEPVSYGQDIHLKSSGSYTCEAICPMRDKNCTVMAKNVSVTSHSEGNGQQVRAVEVQPLSPGTQNDEGEENGKKVLVTEVQMHSLGAQNDEDEENDQQDNAEMQRLSSGTQNSEASPLTDVDVQIDKFPQTDDAAGKSDNASFNSNSNNQEIKACEERIRGLTLLDNELYITIEGQRAVEVFDSKSKMLKKKLTFDGLADPGTMASCTINNCIYIIDKKTDREKQEIFKYSPPAVVASKWLAGFDGRLSVTKENGEVILAAYNRGDKSRLKIYSKEGVLRRTIEFSKISGITYLWHALELSQDVFVVSHGCIYEDSHLHRVCIVRRDGDTIEKSFGRERGLSENKVNEATCLVVTANGSILVTDMKNHRVLLLSKELELKEVLLKYGDNFPEIMHYDEDNGQLFIGINLEIDRGGRVFCLPCTVGLAYM